MELFWTAALEAVIHLLFVHRRVDMRFQRFPQVEPPFAQVTHPGVTVPGTVGDQVGRILFIVPPDLLFADNAIWIKLLNNLVDPVAVQGFSARARSTLKMMGDTTSSDKASSAERTRNVGSTMGLGIQVL